MQGEGLTEILTASGAPLGTRVKDPQFIQHRGIKRTRTGCIGLATIKLKTGGDVWRRGWGQAGCVQVDARGSRKGIGPPNNAHHAGRQTGGEGAGEERRSQHDQSQETGLQ